MRFRCFPFAVAIAVAAMLTLATCHPASAASLVAKFTWQAEGKLNGASVGDSFTLEQRFETTEVTPGPAANSWVWQASATSPLATISGSSSGLLTVTDKLKIQVETRAVRLTATSGLGIGYFGSMNGYDLTTTLDPLTLVSDPFAQQVFATDAGSFLGFNRGPTGFSVVLPATPVDGIPGDYSNNGHIDAADYTVWRDNLGAESLTNRGPGIDGSVGLEDYDFWKSNFGTADTSGQSAAVPEPTSRLMFAFSGFGFLRKRSRR